MATRAWEQPRDEASAAEAAYPSANTAGDASDAVAGASGEGDVGANELAAETPGKRKRRMMTESHLLSAEGLKKIHRTFPYQVSSDVAGQEAKALRSLINMYTQWAFDLYPGLNFEDFLDRTEFLGRQHGVQGLMSDLRDKEHKRALHLEREVDGEEEEEEEKGPDAPFDPNDDRNEDDDKGEEAML